MTATPRRRRRRLMACVTTVAVIGTVLFNAGWLVAGALQEQYSPRRAYLSALASADATHPWVMVTAMLAAGVAASALGIGLALSLPGRRVKVAGAGCMFSGVGLWVSALARHDCNIQLAYCAQRVEAGLVSRAHEVHDVASALVFITVGVSQLTFAQGLRGSGGSRHLRTPSLLLGGLTFVLFTFMSVAGSSDWAGAVQRGIVVGSSVWVCLVGMHLSRRRDLPASTAVGMVSGGTAIRAVESPRLGVPPRGRAAEVGRTAPAPGGASKM